MCTEVGSRQAVQRFNNYLRETNSDKQTGGKPAFKNRKTCKNVQQESTLVNKTDYIQVYED